MTIVFEVPPDFGNRVDDFVTGRCTYVVYWTRKDVESGK